MNAAMVALLTAMRDEQRELFGVGGLRRQELGGDDETVLLEHGADFLERRRDELLHALGVWELKS